MMTVGVTVETSQNIQKNNNMKLLNLIYIIKLLALTFYIYLIPSTQKIETNMKSLI